VNATVVLLHRLPDGSEHFDWLLQRPGGGPLITFRTTASPDLPPPWQLDAERLPDHRDAYLTYEGEIPGARGRVTRIARGACRILQESPNLILARVRFAAVRGELEGRSCGNSLWMLVLRPGAAASCD
jgi:hypothetical protein